MLAAIVSFTFIGAAVVATVSGVDVGSGSRNGDMEEMNAYTTISLKKSNGGNDCKEETARRTTTMTMTTKTTTTTQQSNSAREREGLTMMAAIGSWRSGTSTMTDNNE